MTASQSSLDKALQELTEAPSDAAEDGLQPPNETALTNAEALLRKLHKATGHNLTVYPEPDGGVAVDARGPNNGIAVAICERGGEILCLSTINREMERARYKTVDEAVSGFMLPAVNKLREGTEGQ